MLQSLGEHTAWEKALVLLAAHPCLGGKTFKSNPYADAPTDHVFLDVPGMIEGHLAHAGHVFVQCARKRGPAIRR